MIRFVTFPKAQIYPHDEDGSGTLFAWYDTITDKFILFGGEHVFETWDDFVIAWDHDRIYPLERYKALFHQP